MTTLSYTKARDHLEDIWDETVATREPIAISRRGKESVALLPWGKLEELQRFEKEMRGMEETIHLLSSPANARRLLGALDDIKQGKNLEAITMDELKKKIGLE